MFIQKTLIRNDVAFLSHIHKIEREKRTKRIIGCGFPHFLNELIKIAYLCDFFIIPDENYQNMYTRQVPVKPIAEILNDNLDNYFVICFSHNCYSLLNALIQNGLSERNIEYIDVDFFLETNRDNFSTITTKDRLLEAAEIELIGNDFNKFRMQNAMTLSGKNRIHLMSNARFDFSYICMEDSQINLFNNMDLVIDDMYMRKESQINIYENASISAESLYLCDHALVNVYSGTAEFGHVYVGANARIMVYDHLHIGDDCLISWNVSIMDGDAHLLKCGARDNRCQQIIIHDHVWIGCNSIVLKGVEIGEGCVIGSGSVVTKSIPAHSLAVGCPAKVIRKNIVWEPEYCGFSFCH